MYSFADVAVVACSDTKGGTWEGSKENLKHGWIPLLVRTAADAGAGAAALLQEGALSLDDSEVELAEVFLKRFDSIDDEWSGRSGVGSAARTRELPLDEEHVVAESAAVVAPDPEFASVPVSASSFWQLFLDYLAEHIGEEFSEKAIAEELDLPLTKVREWLSRAAHEELVTRKTRPVRYEVLGRTLW